MVESTRHKRVEHGLEPEAELAHGPRRDAELGGDGGCRFTDGEGLGHPLLPLVQGGQEGGHVESKANLFRYSGGVIDELPQVDPFDLEPAPAGVCEHVLGLRLAAAGDRAANAGLLDAEPDHGLNDVRLVSAPLLDEGVEGVPCQRQRVLDGFRSCLWIAVAEGGLGHASEFGDEGGEGVAAALEIGHLVLL